MATKDIMEKLKTTNEGREHESIVAVLEALGADIDALKKSLAAKPKK